MRISSLCRSPYLFMTGPALRGPARVTEVLSPKNTKPAEYASVDEWGGKAFNLAQALLVGHNVPEFFVVTTSAVDEGIQFAEIRDRCNRIRKLFPGCTFSVRSSATIEDSDKSSFAGMYKSVLNRETDAEIERAVKKVVASLRSQRVLDHKRKMGIETQEKMAVIIQRMVPNPKYSGVIYLPLPTNPAVIGIDYVCGQYADKLMAGKGAGSFIDISNLPPYDEAVAVSENGVYHNLTGITGLVETIQRVKEKSPGNWDIEFCIDKDNGFYFLQQRRLTDVEPPAGFTIDEIKQTIDPRDIIFEGELTRGKTPKEGLVCDVIVGNTDECLSPIFPGIPFFPFGHSEFTSFRNFDALHRGYAVVMDKFSVKLNDATPNKGAVITIRLANRAAHILTIMRTEASHLVYVGVQFRSELLLILQQAGRIRIFADGYRSLVCKAPPEELT